MRPWVRVVLVVIVIVAVVAAGLGAYGVHTLRRALPTLDGELILPGLRQPVEVYRDGWGVPHIYASHADDLFMAQGFVHAQDRFYQMELARRIGQGRLAELFGEDLVDTDRFIRTVGWNRAAVRLAAELDPGAQLALGAYAHGVNQYIALRTAPELALEFALMELTGAPVAIEPWLPEHTMGWGVVLAFMLGGNMESERDRLERLELLGAEMEADLAPPYPYDQSPTIVAARAATPDDPLYANVGGTFAGGVSPRDLGAAPGVGSNNWVVSGARTATGLPLLANDTHLPIQMPSIWYEVGLHCRPVSEECPYDVVGFSFPGTPGVIIGHNRHIAWGVTNLGPDTQDLYILETDPDHPNRYRYQGEWLDMDIVAETIRVNGGAPVQLEVQMTHFGPVVTDAADIAAGRSPMALRWTTLEGGDLLRAVLMLNRAANWADFRAALRYWTWPAQNFVYADVDGNIGYQTPGRIPIRAEEHDGLLPVPGNTTAYEWQGYIPFDKLPSEFNPERGYIVTANNAVVGPEYAYTLTGEWSDYGYRAARIAALLEATEAHTVATFAAIHGDNRVPLADELIAALAALDLADAALTDAAVWLGGWDRQAGMDSAHAALFMGFWAELVAAVYADELGAVPGGGSREVYSLSRLLDDPENAWWDDVRTAEVETRDDILRRAFAEGYRLVAGRLGDNRDAWRWGALHTATFVNQGPGQSGIGVVAGIFNRGPVEVGGSASVVNATSWRASDPFAVYGLPSQRMIVDLSDFANSRSIHTTGQSGHPYSPHYSDMIDLWRAIAYHPMLFDEAAVQAAAESRLTLTVPVALDG